MQLEGILLWDNPQMETEEKELPALILYSFDRCPYVHQGKTQTRLLVKNRLRTGAGSLVFLGGRSVKDPLLLPFINRSRSLRAFISTTSSTGKGQLCIA
jgi:hypothetical protein